MSILDCIPFSKMSGGGNDFIIVNNIDSSFSCLNLSSFVRKVCCRRMSVGSDGLIFLNSSDRFDFRWDFFNSDGSNVSMCGNGARCAARYAYLFGISDKNMVFETSFNAIEAEVVGDLVRVSMPNPKKVKFSHRIEVQNEILTVDVLKLGVPHVVVFVKSVVDLDVVRIGRCIRYHKFFYPEGTNVNFVELRNKKGIYVRTYEKGVENETLSCGTGSVAVAYVCSMLHSFESPILLNNRGGSVLKVYFDKNGDNFDNIFLEGDARIVYTGVLRREGWEYTLACQV